VAVAVELLEAPSTDRGLGEDPESGLSVFVKTGRFGPYIQLGEQEEGSKKKPKTASLFKSMDIETVTIEQALQLLTLPRTVGAHPDDEVAITVQNGPYGPYVKWGKETRSLEEEEQLFAVDLADAVRRLAEPKKRGRQAAPPLKELGTDPNSGGPVEVKDGRFGPYVTDGKVNASLPKGDSPEDVTLDRAAELLQARRDRLAAQGK
jgi:DNA topoisomerase-1